MSLRKTPDLDVCIKSQEN